MLNKPIGQLVIAAATVNDLVNIIFFTQARAATGRRRPPRRAARARARGPTGAR